MQIITIYPRGFGANAYALIEDGQNAIVIDPSGSKVENELNERRLTPAYVLLTHCHFDHVGGVAALQKKGAKVLCSAKTKALIGTSADLFDMAGIPRVPFSVDGVFEENKEKTLCGIRIQAIPTPGHTAGSVCYLVTDKDGGRYLFTGDTLFAGSIGRTDFPTGNIGELRASLKKLSALDDMPVYPGHNEETTLEYERKNNPFME
ncbi:MAG: MBL fold metallo-hydrolase [Clostridia bacterium]|nr:MBL fold metallo-hydrolase [Clostridia bacterium]